MHAKLWLLEIMELHLHVDLSCGYSCCVNIFYSKTRKTLSSSLINRNTKHSVVHLDVLITNRTQEGTEKRCGKWRYVWEKILREGRARQKVSLSEV